MHNSENKPLICIALKMLVSSSNSYTQNCYSIVIPYNISEGNMVEGYSSDKYHKGWLMFGYSFWYMSDFKKHSEPCSKFQLW